MLRAAAILQEIAMAELIGLGDYSRAKGAVFVSSLRPGECIPGVDPNRKTHRDHSNMALFAGAGRRGPIPPFRANEKDRRTP